MSDSPKRARKWLVRIAILVCAAIAFALLFGVYVLNRSKGPEFSVIRGMEPVGIEHYEFVGSSLKGEKRIYVFEADYEKVLETGKNELVKSAGWFHYTPLNSGGGPFTGFMDRSKDHNICVIRGDRTMPPGFRKKVPVSERHKWVVVTEEFMYGPFEAMLHDLWREIKGERSY